MSVKPLIGALLAVTLVSGQAFAAEYAIDKKGQHAFVTFKVGHLGYSYIIGGFNDFDGSFFHDASNPSASKTEVVIQTRSIDTNHAERDKHLRSDDFLDVAKYPTITFKSTGYEAGSDGDKLMGDLTLMGVTKPVTIDLVQIGEGKDPWGGYRNGFQGTTMITASDFGLKDWVGDIEIELNIEGVRK